MSAARKETSISPGEYLARERLADFKSEYHDGQAFAMAGASRRHNLISGNLFSEIHLQLRGRPCEVYAADMRVLSNRIGSYTYPDLVAVCGEPLFLDDEFDTLVNPQVIIEILSPSTRTLDRGIRSVPYRSIESIRDHILVSQDTILVEQSSRQGEGWISRRWDRLDDVLRIKSIGCEVPLRRIHERVSFAEPGPA